jgi:hemerythrin
MSDDLPTAPAPDPAEFAWSDAFLLGFPAMDEVHEDFVARARALRDAPDAELPAALEAMTRHLREHFAQEDAWMTQTGFPPRQCHIDEHAAVLRSAEEVQAVVTQGRLDPVRGFAAALIDWFPGHADYLDAALAHWMCKQKHGGKPVVLRRGVAAR